MRFTRPEDLNTFVKLYTPFLLMIAWVFLLYYSLDEIGFSQIGFLMAIYFLPPIGKESAIPLGIYMGLSPIVVVSSFFMIDFFVGLGFYTSLDFFKHSKIVGKYARWITTQTKRIIGIHKWVERMSFAGCTLWMIIPFQGTGAVMASLLGRAIGLDKGRVFAAVIIGSIIGLLMVTYLTLAAISITSYTTALWIALAGIIITILLKVYHVARNVVVR
ncbi:MAG: small multi-drug export protein [archaeon]